LHSSKTQLALHKINTITLDGSSTTPHEISVSKDLTSVIYREPGLHFVQASAHVGGNETGDVHLWLRLNGKDAENSNCIQTLFDGTSSVVSSQGVMLIDAGDKMELVFSLKNKNLGIVAAFLNGEAASPSLSFSSGKVANKYNLYKTSYAQLSSFKNQFVRDCSASQQYCSIRAVTHLLKTDSKTVLRTAMTDLGTL
ncbi:unnamed protein product, partial [Didymodactylos carnosus]